MSRLQHPNENIEIIIRYAEKLEWFVCQENIAPQCWSRLRCHTSKLQNSTMSIWLQPRFPQIHAKQIIKNLKCLNVRKRIGIILINEEKLKLYEFTFKLKNVNQIDDKLEARIYQHVGDNVLIHAIADTVYLHCSRGADSLEEAIDSVSIDLVPTGYQFELMSQAMLNDTPLTYSE